jgi:hypothetical protein
MLLCKLVGGLLGTLHHRLPTVPCGRLPRRSNLSELGGSSDERGSSEGAASPTSSELSTCPSPYPSFFLSLRSLLSAPPASQSPLFCACASGYVCQRSFLESSLINSLKLHTVIRPIDLPWECEGRGWACDQTIDGKGGGHPQHSQPQAYSVSRTASLQRVQKKVST